MGGVSAPEARLHVEHRHVPPAGRVVEGGGAGAGGARLALDQLEEGLHVGAQPGHQAGPHRGHRLLVTHLQRLQQGAVVPGGWDRKSGTGSQGQEVRERKSDSSGCVCVCACPPVGEVGGDLHHLSDGVRVGPGHSADVQTAETLLLHL